MPATATRFVSRLPEPIQRRLALQSEITGTSQAQILAATLDRELMPLDELARRMAEKAAALMAEAGQSPAA